MAKKLNFVAAYALPNGKHYATWYSVSSITNLARLPEMFAMNFHNGDTQYTAFQPSIISFQPTAKKAMAYAEAWNEVNRANGTLWDCIAKKVAI